MLVQHECYFNKKLPSRRGSGKPTPRGQDRVFLRASQMVDVADKDESVESQVAESQIRGHLTKTWEKSLSTSQLLMLEAVHEVDKAISARPSRKIKELML